MREGDKERRRGTKRAIPEEVQELHSRREKNVHMSVFFFSFFKNGREAWGVK